MTLPIFAKVKALAYGLAATLVAAALSYIVGIDYGQFGAFGPALGMGVGVGVAYIKGETALGDFLRKHGERRAADMVDPRA